MSGIEVVLLISIAMLCAAIVALAARINALDLQIENGREVRDSANKLFEKKFERVKVRFEKIAKRLEKLDGERDPWSSRFDI